MKTSASSAAGRARRARGLTTNTSEPVAIGASAA